MWLEIIMRGEALGNVAAKSVRSLTSFKEILMKFFGGTTCPG